MNTTLIIIAIVLAIVGILGAVIPGLPGPPISWIGLMLLSFTTAADYSPMTLVLTALLAAGITVLDYLVPSFFTKKMGGGKAGIWGCNIGLVVSLIGVPFGPQGLLGVIFWPFVGALVGELIFKKAFPLALKAACGAFIGFLTGTLMKLAYSIAVAVVIVKDVVLMFFS